MKFILIILSCLCLLCLDVAAATPPQPSDAMKTVFRNQIEEDELVRLLNPEWHHTSGITDLSLDRNDVLICLHQGRLYEHLDMPLEEAAVQMENDELSEINGYLFFKEETLYFAKKIVEEDGQLWFQISVFESPYTYSPYTETPYISDSFCMDTVLKERGITGNILQVHTTFIGATSPTWGFTYVKTDAENYVLYYEYDRSEAIVYTEEYFRTYAKRYVAYGKTCRDLYGRRSGGHIEFADFIEKYDSGDFTFPERVGMVIHQYPVVLAIVPLFAIVLILTVCIIIIRRRKRSALPDTENGGSA